MDTFKSRQPCLWPLSQNPVFLHSQTNFVFLNSPIRLAPVMATFFMFKGVCSSLTNYSLLFLNNCYFSLSCHQKEKSELFNEQTRIWEMKGDKYPQFLAKIQVSATFQMQEEMILPNIQSFVWRCNVGAHLGSRKPKETSVVPCFAMKAGIHLSRNS